MANGSVPFNGTETGTFSAVIDDAIARSARPDRRADIIQWARASMREAQVIAFFERDFIEDQITAVGDPYIWTRPAYFRQMRTVRYPEIRDGHGNSVYPRFVQPGRALRNFNYFYYAGTDYFTFAGQSRGLPNTTTSTFIDLGYYSYFPRLAYYKVADRPARYSLEDEAWWYKDETLDDAGKEAARNRVSNWMLFDWYELVMEGTLAKVFKTFGDSRAVSSFALFKSYQKDLLAGESRASMAGET